MKREQLEFEIDSVHFSACRYFSLGFVSISKLSDLENVFVAAVLTSTPSPGATMMVRVKNMAGPNKSRNVGCPTLSSFLGQSVRPVVVAVITPQLVGEVRVNVENARGRSRG